MSKLLIAVIAEQSLAELVKGSDMSLKVQIKDRSTGLPTKIEGFSSCEIRLEKEDGTVLGASGTLDSADLGTIKFELSETQTAELEAGEEISAEVELESTAGTQIFHMEGALVIKDALFS